MLLAELMTRANGTSRILKHMTLTLESAPSSDLHGQRMSRMKGTRHGNIYLDVWIGYSVAFFILGFGWKSTTRLTPVHVIGLLYSFLRTTTAKTKTLLRPLLEAIGLEADDGLVGAHSIRKLASTFVHFLGHIKGRQGCKEMLEKQEACI